MGRILLVARGLRMDAILMCLVAGFAAVTSVRFLLLLKARINNGDAGNPQDRH
jgi:hypothetical protein